jgi:hypothetical protein
MPNCFLDYPHNLSYRDCEDPSLPCFERPFPFSVSLFVVGSRRRRSGALERAVLEDLTRNRLGRTGAPTSR